MIILSDYLKDSFRTYLSTLNTQLILFSGGRYSAKEAIAMDNPFLLDKPKGAKETAVVQQLFLSKNGNNSSLANVLKSKIEALKDKYLLFVEQFWDDDKINVGIFSVPSRKTTSIQQLANELPLMTTVNYFSETKSNKTWESCTFADQPLAAIVLLLSQLENNAVVSEYKVLNFLASNIANGCDFGYDEFILFAEPPISTISLGETYEAEIVLGTYATKADYVIKVDGQTIDKIEGKGVYKIQPKTIGKQEYTVKILITNPLTKEVESLTKRFFYEVIKKQ